ncbi:MAG TPA: hypothetical protein VIX17_11755 [Pyrinomonadaceae bacterium]
MNFQDYIDEIKAVFLNLHNTRAEHVETVPVTEEFQGQTVWDGEVEVFELKDHPKAKRGYGWGHATGDDDQGRRYVTVLELPPVESPATAVRASIIKDFREAEANAEG